MIPQSSLFNLSGKTIVVAGASRGIGKCLAAGLSNEGANVVGFARTEINDRPKYEYIVCDITKSDSISELISSIYKLHGKIDGYLHVSGITSPSKEGMQTKDIFEDTLQVNLMAAYNCMSSVGNIMTNQGYGSIVAVSSIGSILGFPNNPGYIAAKGGLRMLVKSLALDYGKNNVRVNSLVPGYIHTDMTSTSYNNPELRKQRSDRTMLGRWGAVDDLLGAAVFLLSDSSSYVTGSDLVVDGGWTAKGL